MQASHSTQVWLLSCLYDMARDLVQMGRMCSHDAGVLKPAPPAQASNSPCDGSRCCCRTLRSCVSERAWNTKAKLPFPPLSRSRRASLKIAMNCHEPNTLQRHRLVPYSAQSFCRQALACSSPGLWTPWLHETLALKLLSTCGNPAYTWPWSL